MNLRTWVARCYCFQMIAILLWWVALVARPEWSLWFRPRAWPSAALAAFSLPDTLILIGGSGLAAFAVSRDSRWANPAAWLVAGAASYATLYCVATSVMTGEAWIASATMSVMSASCLALATLLGSDGDLSQPIRPVRMTPSAAVAWTLLQTSVFWCLFLWIIPQGIVTAETALNIPSFPPIRLASVGFALASTLGLSSGLTMAIQGRGTPLPTATAVEFVVGGPYRFVRNPMALAGISQGVLIGLWLGSYSVIIYSLCGALLWHRFVRPVEEADLAERFGADYERYRREVRLWMPGLPAPGRPLSNPPKNQ